MLFDRRISEDIIPPLCALVRAAMPCYATFTRAFAVFADALLNLTT